MSRENIRLALPSKGRMAELSFEFLEKCGLRVHRPNSRQYIASIPMYPNVEVILQRPGDIAIGVRQGSLDLGMVGYDLLAEKNFGQEHKTLILHDALGYGHCTLNFAAPNALGVDSIDDLRDYANGLASEGKTLRVATKFPKLTADFLQRHNVELFRLIDAEGTLEIAPMIGFADVIVDLVSSGQTLRDNHLHTLEQGELVRSQMMLVANRQALSNRPNVLAIARVFLENIEAYLRAKESVMVVANMRGDSAEIIANRMFNHSELAGLRGPTIAPIYTKNGNGHRWFSISIAIKKSEMTQTINALRSIGGSGVIVTPALYIFEEEPKRYRAMLDALGM